MANTLRRPGIPPGLRRDADSANRVSGDRLRDEARGFHVVGELAQVFRRGGPPLRRAHRLLHGRKAALQHTRPRELRRVGSQARLEPGEHFELVLDENIVRTLNPLNAHERGVLEAAAQVQVVGAVHRHGDAYALAVDVRDRANRRARGTRYPASISRYAGLKAISPARCGSFPRKATSQAPAFAASASLPAVSKATSSTGTPSRRPSSRPRSTAIPRYSPLAGSLLTSRKFP